MSESKSSGGIGVVGLLGVLFVALKLTGYITWSWWWVTLPFWAWLAVVLGIFLGGIIVVSLITFLIFIFSYAASKRNSNYRRSSNFRRI